jgi:hypothetical protein
MLSVQKNSWRLLPLIAISTITLLVAAHPALQQTTIEGLTAKLQKQYAAIYYLFANGPGKQVYPADFRERLRRWQADLAQSFTDAQATIDEIIRLHPPDEEMWRERSDTMHLYAQPPSPPQTRTVFGVTEVDKRARLIEAPAAVFPANATGIANARGEVRLRLVLAADGTVKYIFPMKPLDFGLTEAAIEAAHHIKFVPAVRDGKPASQFLTLSYEFRNRRGLAPYVPEHEFYF